MNLKISSLSLFLIIGFIFSLPAFAKPKYEQTLRVSGGKLTILLTDQATASQKSEIRWLERAARAVSDYFGRYPVKEVSISVTSEGQGSRIGGTTWDGERIQMRLGDKVTDEELENDWTATHEMFHLGFPGMDHIYDWMSEGLATYLEPLARAREGYITPEQFWKDFLHGVPQGAPASSDKGLDLTRTWGRTYWGGAGFWFLADIKIREKTNNKKSLDTACLAILDQGGDGSADWSLAQLLATADKAIGLPIISELHKEMGLHPGWAGFTETFHDLGVTLQDDKVLFNEAAKFAALRHSLTAKK